MLFCSGVEATPHLELKISLPGGLTTAYCIKLYQTGQTIPYQANGSQTEKPAEVQTRIRRGNFKTCPGTLGLPRDTMLTLFCSFWAISS